MCTNIDNPTVWSASYPGVHSSSFLRKQGPSKRTYFLPVWDQWYSDYFHWLVQLTGIWVTRYITWLQLSHSRSPVRQTITFVCIQPWHLFRLTILAFNHIQLIEAIQKHRRKMSSQALVCLASSSRFRVLCFQMPIVPVEWYGLSQPRCGSVWLAKSCNFGTTCLEHITLIFYILSDLSDITANR